MIQRILTSLIVVLFAGCQTTKVSSNMDYHELSAYKAQMHIEGTELVVELSNPPGLMVYELQHSREGEKILIGAHRMSSGGGKMEYRINLSLHTLPANIKEYLYWVNRDGSIQRLSPQYL